MECAEVACCKCITSAIGQYNDLNEFLVPEQFDPIMIGRCEYWNEFGPPRENDFASRSDSTFRNPREILRAATYNMYSANLKVFFFNILCPNLRSTRACAI